MENSPLKNILVRKYIDDPVFITYENYGAGDMFKGEPGDEPSWVSSERDQFNEFRDKDKDGFMDLNEVRI